MAEFADASDRREAMKTFLNEAPAAEVAEQTPADEGVETVEELLETPATRKEGTPAEEALPAGEEEVEEVEEIEEEAAEEEEAGKESDEEREAREATEAEELEADEVTPEQQVLLDHNEAFEGLVEALDTTDYPIDFGDTPEQLAAGMQEVGLRLADAHAMYSIMDGKGADGIFERIKKFQGQEAHDFALNEVLKYAAKVGLIESADGTPAAAAKPGEASAAAAPAETPREKALRLENEKLKKDRATETQTKQSEAAAERQKKIFTSSMAEVERLGTEAKLDKDTLMDFVVPYIIRQVGGKKDIINRCARGNFVDIQKFFDEAVNKISGKRVTAQNAKVQQRKVRDKVVPKRVAGEDRTRTAAVKPTFDLKTSDGRRAAAKAGLRG